MKRTGASIFRKISIALFLLFLVVQSLGSSVFAGAYYGNSKADVGSLKNRVMASQFLSHATFGPTAAEIDALWQRMDQLGAVPAMEEWIDTQMSLPPTLHEDTALNLILGQGLDPLAPGLSARPSYRQFAWWQNSLVAEDQLRQRVAWALSQIFVINERGDGFNNDRADASGKPTYLGVSSYYDLMVANAFGNYRQLLSEVTYHPVMGIFLSHLKNPKANPEKNTFPDENYAREVLQLFSVGIYELNDRGVYKTDRTGALIELYDNETIKAFARVFTGLGWGGGSSFGCGNSCRNLHDPMTMFDEAHDTDEKVLLGGEVIPGGQSGEDDIAAALDNIAGNANVAPFISRLLIQRLVKSNPSKNYIRRVSQVFNNDGSGQKGNLAAVVKAILLDKEAVESINYSTLRKPWGILAESGGTEHTRLKEPVLRYTAFLRAFHPVSDFYAGFMIPSQYNDMNQAPYQSPSVFNFYQAEHQPNGTILNYRPSKSIPNGNLYAPEFQILTSVSSNRFANQLRADVADGKADFSFAGMSADVVLDFNAEIAAANDPYQLVSHLDLIFCNGAMAESSRNIIASAVEEETDNPEDRAKGAILATLTSPDCAVTE